MVECAQLGVPFLDWGPKVVERLFEVLNWSGSRALSYKEFVCGATVLYAGTQTQKLQLVFQMFDASNRSTVTRSDFEALAGAVLIGDAVTLTAEVTTTRGYADELRARGAAAPEEPRRRGEEVREEDVIRAEVSTDALSALEETVGALAVVGFDRDGDGRLNFDEWRLWAENSHDVREFIRAMDRVIVEE